jgi:hypothetical protein
VIVVVRGSTPNCRLECTECEYSTLYYSGKTIETQIDPIRECPKCGSEKVEIIPAGPEDLLSMKVSRSIERRRRKMEKKWHIDSGCNEALIRLSYALYSFGEISGREYTLVLMPHTSDEPVHISLNGKSMVKEFASDPVAVAMFAMKQRGI